MPEKQTNLKFSEELKSALREKAQTEGVSLTDLVNRICQQYVAQGFSNPSTPPIPNRSLPNMNQYSTSPALADELSQLSRLVVTSLEVMSISSRLSLLEHQFLTLKDQVLASTSALERRLSNLEADNSNPAPHASSDSDPNNSEVNPTPAPPITPDQSKFQIQQLLKLLQVLDSEQNSGMDSPLNKDEGHSRDVKNCDVVGHNGCSTNPVTPVESQTGEFDASSVASTNSESGSDTYSPDQAHPNSESVPSESNSPVTSTITADEPTTETTQWLTPAKAYEVVKQRGYPSSKTAFCMIVDSKNPQEKYAQYGLSYVEKWCTAVGEEKAYPAG